jgi:glycosyltransferase involved in cell wall biosynthesis
LEKPKIVFFGEGTVSDEIRMDLTGKILRKRGYPIITEARYNPDGSLYVPEQFDIAIFSRPHASNAIKELKKQGVKVIVDQDDDFWSIPKSHVAYNSIGPGSPVMLKALEDCLKMADVVTTSSQVLVERLGQISGRPTIMIPNGFNVENSLWHLPRNKRGADFVNIGWCGTVTHRQDFLQCLDALLKISKNFSNVRVVIGGDPEIYDYLSPIPEMHKLFLPHVPYGMYPHILTYMDILLAPLVNDTFNQAKSDIKCVDAGVRHMPWVASRLPAYEDWGKGGILVDSNKGSTNTGKWMEAIMSLVFDAELRKSLGEEGWAKANGREQNNIVDLWEPILMDLAKEKQQ